MIRWFSLPFWAPTLDFLVAVGVRFEVAKMLADRDVDIVIGIQIGKHMEEALKMRVRKVHEMTGSVWVELLDSLKHVKKYGFLNILS